MSTHCRKCHIKGKPGVALKNYILKENGNSLPTPKNPKLVKVLKCPKCGASWTKK